VDRHSLSYARLLDPIDGPGGRAIARLRAVPVILSAVRTPVGRFLGGLAGLSAAELGGVAIEQAIARAGIDAAELDEVLMGNVVSAGMGQAPARQAAHRGGVPFSVSAAAVNQVCGSGLRAVMLAAQAIVAGDAKVLVAGGMESMSRAPFLLDRARTGYRLGDGMLIDAMVRDGLWCTFENQHMGMAAEWIADEYGIERDELDAYAAESHHRATVAMDNGWFAAELIEVPVVRKGQGPSTVTFDEVPRRDSSIERLGRLEPSFKQGGKITAGNASALADGAAALVIADESWANSRGLAPLARLTGWATAAIEPQKVFACPPLVVRRLAQLSGRAPEDYELVEINEAFSSQVVANTKELGLDLQRVNVVGGGIALGHPIGATGARVLVTLIHSLRRTRLTHGLAALCLGGGGAVGVTLEAMPA
jgi:acetyl-CoA C-acetyltransferase